MTWGLYGFVADLTFAWQAVPLPRLPVRKGLVTALPAQILPSVPVRKGFVTSNGVRDTSSLRYELQIPGFLPVVKGPSAVDAKPADAAAAKQAQQMRPKVQRLQGSECGSEFPQDSRLCVFRVEYCPSADTTNTNHK
jgi:hypothetical protein